MEYELSKSLSQYSGDDAMDTISIGWKETQKSVRSVQQLFYTILTTL